MYYFMWDIYSEKYGASIPLGFNPWKVVSECECRSRITAYEGTIKFDIKGKPQDYYFVDTEVMISERFCSFLEKQGLSGYTIRDAVVREWNGSVKNADSLKYFEMVVTGRCGLLRNMSGITLPHCKKCGRRFSHTGICTNGVSFAPESYDGSDIFTFINLPNIPIVTEKLRDAIISQGFTNIRFVPLNEKVFDDTVPIHLIQQWLNEGRASKEQIEVWLENGIITPDMIPDNNKPVQE